MHIAYCISVATGTSVLPMVVLTIDNIYCETGRQKDASETEEDGLQNSDKTSMGQIHGLQRSDKKNGLR